VVAEVDRLETRLGLQRIAELLELTAIAGKTGAHRLITFVAILAGTSRNERNEEAS
jgi:hypothetical protein